MRHYTNQEIGELEKVERANLINSLSGYKPANLIGTISAAKQANLAIFSSVVHLGTTPPLFGFITRPTTEVPRHTYENIRETGVYTINHVHESFVEKAHFTSVKFDRATSEFAACQLTEEYLEGFAAPFVKESKIKLGLQFVEQILINRDFFLSNTRLGMLVRTFDKMNAEKRISHTETAENYLESLDK